MSIEERAESIMLCLNNVCNTGYTLQKCDYDFIGKQIDEIKKEATDVQPAVHGKWDTHDVVKVLCSGKTLDGFCQCEACGDVFPLAYSEYNYCPKCGARMDGDTK